MYQLKVFAVTMVAEREKLGETINRWVQENKVSVDEIALRQSSDNAFHCLSVTLKYRTAASPSEVGFVYDECDYSRIEIYSATKARDRDVLGERAGQLGADDAVAVLQSSDREFHCLTIVVFRG